MSRKLTTEQFIEKAVLQQTEKYSISEWEYFLKGGNTELRTIPLKDIVEKVIMEYMLFNS